MGERRVVVIALLVTAVVVFILGAIGRTLDREASEVIGLALGFGGLTIERI